MVFCLVRHSNVTGDILVNDEERNLSHFRKLSCYIMQRDELCPHLSVMELMTFAANLKLGNRLSKEEKKMRVSPIFFFYFIDIFGIGSLYNPPKFLQFSTIYSG